ncbi:MAG TPA: hypothetical protein VFF40_10450 [Acidimicrobiia bacterium]|nr:hypothetical protein [Acidimicrobiia bacterium]
MPNLVPDWLPWMQPAGRLIWSLIATAIGLVIVVALTRRPRSPEPATWAQCMAGAVGVFAMFLVVYAIVPNEWLNFANAHLVWSSDKFVITHNQWATNLPPIDFPYSALRDSVAAGIYIVFFGLNLYLFSAWQKRPRAEVAEGGGTEKVVRTSRFGRPVKAKA